MPDYQQAAVLVLFEKIMGEDPTTPTPVRFALLSDEDKSVFREALEAAEPYMRRKWAEELVERIESSNLGAPLHIDPDGAFHMASGPEMRAELCEFIMDFGRASMRDQILEIVEKGDGSDEQPST